MVSGLNQTGFQNPSSKVKLACEDYLPKRSAVNNFCSKISDECVDLKWSLKSGSEIGCNTFSIERNEFGPSIEIHPKFGGASPRKLCDALGSTVGLHIENLASRESTCRGYQDTNSSVFNETSEKPSPDSTETAGSLTQHPQQPSGPQLGPNAVAKKNVNELGNAQSPSQHSFGQSINDEVSNPGGTIQSANPPPRQVPNEKALGNFRNWVTSP